MDATMTATTLFTVLSTVLLIALLAIYLRNMRHVKSRLLIGLMIFTVVFLVQNMFSMYYSLTMMDYYVPAVSIHILVFSIMQTIAFSVMLWITIE